MAFYNRRAFLQASAAGFLGATGALSGLGRSQAFAASTTGYKAMVGVFFKGGVDMFDALLPRDQANYDKLVGLRGGVINSHADGSRDPDNQLALNPSNTDLGTRRFGLAPELGRTAELFNSGEAAIVGNVGPLLVPTDRAGMESGASSLPANLFSHNDQQSTWMAFGPEGQRAGWGGLMMDEVIRGGGLSRPEFGTLTAGSGDVFLASTRTTTFKVPRNPQDLDVDMVRNAWPTSGTHGAAARERLADYLRRSADGSPNRFARDVIAAQSRGLTNLQSYKEAYSSVGALGATFPDTRIGRQLEAVANAIHIRGAVGNSRQVFYVDQGGFDTHDEQGQSIGGPLGQTFDAIAAFRDAMIATNAWDDVCLFTMSDFGRTLTDNGDGTDHGWGSHHFVFGGSVAGGRIYGQMPELEADSARYTAQRARLIPTTSVDQYAATIGSWFGLDSREIDRVLPNLSRFDGRDLGFMGGGAV